MKRLACGAVMLTLIGIGLIPVGAAEGENEVPTIKQIMGKLTKGKTSLTPKIGAELKKAEPNWETLQSQTTEYTKYADFMEQNEPPKGNKDEWKDVAKAFAVDAKELDDAVQKKEHEAAKVAHAKIAKSCMACHRAFKGK